MHRPQIIEMNSELNGAANTGGCREHWEREIYMHTWRGLGAKPPELTANPVFAKEKSMPSAVVRYLLCFCPAGAPAS